MALTIRTNGNGATNLITAQWFNDYHDLFTGIMLDQPITFRPNVTLQAIAGAPGAPTLSLTTGSNLGVGGYQYGVTFVSSDGGETVLGTTASISTTAGNQSVNLAAIPVDSTNVAIKRNIYRTKVGGTTFYLLHTINDNTTTTYVDSINDSGLPSTTPPAHPTFGGAIVFKDQNGNTTLTIANDGALVGGGTGAASFGNTTINGTFTATGAATFNSSLTASGTITTPTGLVANVMSAQASNDIGFHVGSGQKVVATINGTNVFSVNSSGANLLAGALKLLTGTISRLSIFTASVNTSSTSVPHGLGVVPAIILLQVTGGVSTTRTVMYDPNNTDANNTLLTGNGSFNVIGLAIA